MNACFFFQRATLAEKEVTTLKEQLNSNTTSNNCENKDTSNMDRQSFETEIAAKDKEVSQQDFYRVAIAIIMPSHCFFLLIAKQVTVKHRFFFVNALPHLSNSPAL
nr:unnamed protein product [Callosobruchus chinensis]